MSNFQSCALLTTRPLHKIDIDKDLSFYFDSFLSSRNGRIKNAATILGIFSIVITVDRPTSYARYTQQNQKRSERVLYSSCSP